MDKISGSNLGFTPLVTYFGVEPRLSSCAFCSALPPPGVWVGYSSLKVNGSHIGSFYALGCRVYTVTIAAHANPSDYS